MKSVIRHRHALSADDHRERNRILKKTPRYQHIWSFYRPLFQASLIARYLREDQNSPDCEVFSRYMPPETVRQKVLNHWLRQIEQSAAKLAGGDESFNVTAPAG